MGSTDDSPLLEDSRPAKRRRTAKPTSPMLDHAQCSDLEDSNEDDFAPFTRRKTCPQSFHTIAVPGFKRPRSKYAGSRSSPTEENVALENIILIPGSGYGTGYAARLQFEGSVMVDGHEVRLEDVEFEVLSIDNYGSDVDTVSDGVYLQSAKSKRKNIWYHLTTPSDDYHRFYHDFLWVADFTKHAIAFLTAKENVGVADFKSDFYRWIMLEYGNSRVFARWLARSGRTDFRKYVTAYPEFLRKEALGPAIDHDGMIRAQPLWQQCHPDRQILGAMPYHPSRLDVPTVVTPYVKWCFEESYFAAMLSEQTLSPPVETKRGQIGIKWDRRLSWPWKECDTHIHRKKALHNEVAIGDIVAIEADPKEISAWKNSESTYIGYVHDTHKITLKDGSSRMRLYLLWLYRPRETNLRESRYCHENELFFSDHCNCNCSLEEEKVYADHIVGFPPVELFSGRIPNGCGFFVRQTYITHDKVNAWMSLATEHLQCYHRTKKQVPALLPAYSTHLIKHFQCHFLEPVIIERNAGSLLVRKLLRRTLFDKTSRANEVVYSDGVFPIPRNHIIRPCHVRHYTQRDVRLGSIPAPYSYKGAADCWILTSRVEEGRLIDIETLEGINLVPGLDPQQCPDPNGPLPTLDLFCGGGGFDRALEECNASESRYAVDINGPAIHTNLANRRRPDGLWWGSAVAYMVLALRGTDPGVPQVGDVSNITAGSPCTGFSTLQQFPNSDQSKRNSSLAALVIAFIDLYRPDYAFMENVVGVKRILPQVESALVGLGYQVQRFNEDAINHGTCGMRRRIIIAIAAPGLTPINPPPATHFPANGRAQAALGTGANGETYGTRVIGMTPFTFVSAEEGTNDLPLLGNTPTGICVQEPDHRPSLAINEKYLTLIPLIPSHLQARLSAAGTETRAGSILTVETAKGLHLARKLGRVPDENLEWFLPGSKKGSALQKTFVRQRPEEPFPTITTACKIRDGHAAVNLHWDRHGPLTIMEARRAQAIPDDTILIGTPAQQWKQVGNGVSHNLAAAIAFQLAQAMSANERKFGTMLSSPSTAHTNGLHTTRAHPQPNSTDKKLNAAETEKPVVNGSGLGVIKEPTPTNEPSEAESDTLQLIRSPKPNKVQNRQSRRVVESSEEGEDNVVVLLSPGKDFKSGLFNAHNRPFASFNRGR